MLRAVAEEVRGLDTGPKALRQFGLVVGGVFAGIAAVVVWRSGWAVGPTAIVLGSVGGALVLFGLAAPALLRPVYRAWMALAFALGFVMTRVILTVVFVGLVVPIGFVLRLLGKDLLDERIDRDARSYWRPKHYADPSPERLEKYY
jgi:hypothetical protein